MDTVAQIGPSIRIKGEVTAQEPLTISGHVDGTIAIDGHALTIAAGGRVSATIVAHTIVIGGEVSGRMDAGARIIVCETARIEGDLSAPAVSLADGARIRGRVQTAERKKTALPLSVSSMVGGSAPPAGTSHR